MNLYNMPVLTSSTGLMTLFNLLDQGSIGGEKIFLDSALSEKIYSMEEIESSKYRELALKSAQEFDIKPPQPEKCASVGAWIGQCVETAFNGILGSLFNKSGLILILMACVGVFLLSKRK